LCDGGLLTEDVEPAASTWLVPFVNFWVTMASVAFIDYGISLAFLYWAFSFGPFFLGPGWVVTGLLAAVAVGFLSEFIVESPTLAALEPRTRVRLAILAAAIVCANSIYLGIRYLEWASKQPVVS